MSGESLLLTEREQDFTATSSASTPAGETGHGQPKGPTVIITLAAQEKAIVSLNFFFRATFLHSCYFLELTRHQGVESYKTYGRILRHDL